MKKKKLVILTVLAALAAMILFGCGGAKAADFTSKSGITVTATDKWQQLNTAEELSELYTNAVDSEMVDLALKNSTSYFTIETADCTADVADLKDVVAFLKTQLADVDEETIYAQLENEYGAEIVDLYKKLVNATDEEFDKIYQDLSNEDWYATLEESAPNYEFVGEEAITLLGKESTLSEYKYTNDDGVLLHHYEAVILKDGILYTLNSWSDDDNFDKNKEVLKTLITNAKYTE